MGVQTVHMFVFDTLADWEPGFAIAGLNNQQGQVRPGGYRVRTVGMSTKPVITQGGVTILPDLALDDLDPRESAMLILPGGTAWESGGNTEAIEKAKAFLEAGVPVAAICAATAALARAGLLDDRQHTSNAREYLQTTNYRGGQYYQDELAVADGNVITAAAMGSLEFAYQIFKKLGVYSPEALEAWYALFKTGDPAHYATLQQASAASSA